MNFLIPCDDIVTDLAEKHESLCVNPQKVQIGYREVSWMDNQPIKLTSLNGFLSLMKLEGSDINADNIAYIRYIDIFLWHKAQRIDRINGSGNTSKTDQWSNIKDAYASALCRPAAEMKDCSDDDTDEKKDGAPNVRLSVTPRPPSSYNGSTYYGYWYHGSYYCNNSTASDMIANGCYEVKDPRDSSVSTKVNIEKTLKKSFKKTKLYHATRAFQFLTAKQIDSVYRVHENMRIDISKESTLNALYRLRQKGFKKLMVLNANGARNGLSTVSTLSHSLSRHNYEVHPNDEDSATQFLMTDTMVYSPHCLFFRDAQGKLCADTFKVSVLTAHPVDAEEYFKAKSRIFGATEKTSRLKELDAKANGARKDKGKSKKNRGKTKSERKEAAEELMTKLDELREEVRGIMTDRIRRMIEIAIYNGCDAVVFDAFGCDNGHEVQEIASIFAEFMHSVYYNCFKSVTFTVLDEERHHSRRSGTRKKEEASRFTLFSAMFEEKFA